MTTWAGLTVHDNLNLILWIYKKKKKRKKKGSNEIIMNFFLVTLDWNLNTIHRMKTKDSIKNTEIQFYKNANYQANFMYCESTFIHWHQSSWFLQNAFIARFLNSWFQTLKTTINGKIVFRWKSTKMRIKNDFTVIRIFVLLFIPNRIYGQWDVCSKWYA